MTENDWVTESKIKEFSDALKELKQKECLHPIQRQIYFRALTSMLNDLKQQLIEYKKELE